MLDVLFHLGGASLFVLASGGFAWISLSGDLVRAHSTCDTVRSSEFWWRQLVCHRDGQCRQGVRLVLGGLSSLAAVSQLVLASVDSASISLLS